MQKLAQRHAFGFQLATGLGLFLACHTPAAVNAMTVSGPITANAVTVTGDVTMSSTTISTFTVTGLLNISGTPPHFSGTVLQVKLSSSTEATSTSSTTYQPVLTLVSTITLSSADNYIRLSLTGSLSAENATLNSGYITIMRDGSVDLGNTIDNTGLASATTNLSTTGPYKIFGLPAGIRITDSPGDTNPHVYQVYLRSDQTCTGCYAAFGQGGITYFLLEEVKQ